MDESGVQFTARPAELDLTIVILCRDEEGSIARCVEEALGFLERNSIDGEALVVDNGSRDRSAARAEKAGARVVSEPNPGYGVAIAAGIAAARGRYIILGDGDGEHDLGALEPFYDRLLEGCDFVFGNRFMDGAGGSGGMLRDAGTAALSAVGRALFRSPARDFNCGLRGFRTSSARALGLRCPGMEAASEMVVKAARSGFRVAEAPAIQRRALDPERASHLRVWRDGWRHLRLLLTLSPRWLYLYPGCALLAAGALALLAPIVYPVEAGGRFGAYTMLFGCAFASAGAQLAMFSLLASAFCDGIGLAGGLRLARSEWLPEVGILAGAAMVALGTAGGVWSLFIWAQTGGPDLETRLRVAIPSVTLVICGLQMVFSAFLFALLKTQGGSAR